MYKGYFLLIVNSAFIMHQQKYSLTWQTYSDHLRDMMKEMMNDVFTDATLITEDRKHIKVHKNILSASSPVFQDIMSLEKSANQSFI